ncbi:DNA helicase Pif1 like protein, partial [Mycena vitilis]
MLNVEQRRAHDIIEQHVRRTMAGTVQEQLLMIVRGEGGTGKTVLLNAIADTFEYLQVQEWLAKTATTGVAASLVGGTTVHSWAAIPVNAADTPQWMDRAAPATVEKRKRRILPAKYVNIDECSMLTKKMLAQLSQ